VVCERDGAGKIIGGIVLMGIGLALYLDSLWPGMLIVIGIALVVGGIIQYHREEQKRIVEAFK